MELRNAIESLIYKTAKSSAKGKMTRDIKQQHAIYVKKLNEMKALLVRLAKNHVQFSEINPAVLKDIYEQNTALSCITGKSSGSSTCKKLAYCFSVEKKDSNVSDVSNDSDECGLYIPKRNLVDNADNEHKYYTRLADELLRYRRIRAFMLHPNKYLTFDDIHYNLKDNEMLLFEPDVKEYLEENNRAVAMNDYIKYKSYYTTEGEEFIDDDDEDENDDEDGDEEGDEEGVDVD
jgi:hypothetical protein